VKVQVKQERDYDDDDEDYVDPDDDEEEVILPQGRVFIKQERSYSVKEDEEEDEEDMEDMEEDEEDLFSSSSSLSSSPASVSIPTVLFPAGNGNSELSLMSLSPPSSNFVEFELSDDGDAFSALSGGLRARSSACSMSLSSLNSHNHQCIWFDQRELEGEETLGQDVVSLLEEDKNLLYGFALSS
jgi:hypothetical protein